MKIKVSAYSGYRGEEKPRYFELENKRISVTEISRQWITPENRCFKVSADDGKNYTLIFDGNQWHLEK